MKVIKNRFFRNTPRGAGKAGGSAESVYLVPPQNSNALYSLSVLKSLDVISEGPIEGLCLSNGERAENSDVLSSVYFDETPVKVETAKSSWIQGFGAENIQLVDRLSINSLNASLNNIESNINQYISAGDSSDGLAQLALQSLSRTQEELGDLFNNFDEHGALAGHLGIIQFDIEDVTTNLNSTLYSNAKSPIGLNFLLNEDTHERYVKVENGEEIIKIPKNIFGFTPDFDSTDIQTSADSIFELKRIRNFIGGGIFFFYIGDEVATGAGGEFLTGKFLLPTPNQSEIQSGIDNNYDIFLTGSSIEFLNTTHGQVCPSFGETIGKSIRLGASVDNNIKYNFNNVSVETNLGYEFQKPIANYSQIKRDTPIYKSLLGPFAKAVNDEGPGASDGVTILDQFGNITTYSKVGLGNNDVRTDSFGDGFTQNFAIWNDISSVPYDRFGYTHIIYQSEVDELAPTIQINLLKDTEATDDDTLGRSEPAGLVIDFYIGFENSITSEESLVSLLDRGVSPKTLLLNTFTEKKSAGYYGLADTPYQNTPYSFVLPKNSVLKNLQTRDIPGMTTEIADEYGLDFNEVLFPNESWRQVNRFVTTEKRSHETESVLIQRVCSLASVTEKINSEFSYPFSALVGTTLNARTFSTSPIRTYDARLKKVLVPSNYCPLKADGEDKRFIINDKKYGERRVTRLTNAQAALPGIVSLGIDNFEISFKFKSASLLGAGLSGNCVFRADGGSANIIFLQEDGKFVFKADNITQSDVLIEFDYSVYSSNDVFEFSIKCVDRKYTINLTVNNVFQESKSALYTNIRPSLVYEDQFYISQPSANTSIQIADFKIKKNNQLLHHFDGTQISTLRFGPCLKDRIGGFHAHITGGYVGLSDPDFEFGRNKEQVYIGEWDGTFKLAWTDNPAWILYDLMINPVYGIRNQIDDIEDIDIFELYMLGRYADAVDSEGYFDGVSDFNGGLEPRFSCNMILREKENAFNVIGNIASIFRCIAYWAGSSFNFSIDKPKEATSIFNNGNVTDGSFSYGDIPKQSRFTRVEVLYADKNDFYKLKKEFIEDEERIRQYGLITNTQNGIGCTSRSQARRLGKYIILSNRLETETVSFTTDQKALLLVPGDIIRVDDEIKNFEINYGRVLDHGVSNNNFYVSIENTTDPDSIITGSDGGIYLYKSRGQTEIKSLYNIIKFNQPYTIGEDSDKYVGELSQEKINEAYESFLFKAEITGVEPQQNATKLYLDLDSDQQVYFSELKNGSTFNVELENEVNNFFKVTSIQELEPNILEVQGLQYDYDKFEQIESFDFKEIDKNTYNIGLVSQNINRPSPPSGFTVGVYYDGISTSITGQISGVLDSSETKYRVSAFAPNGSYFYKEFLKDTSLSPPVTEYSLFNLSQIGGYTVSVTSLRNPESADSPEKTISIGSEHINTSLKFKKVTLKGAKQETTTSQGELSYKTGESLTINDNFHITLQNDDGIYVPFNSNLAPYVTVKIFGENDDFISEIREEFRSNDLYINKIEKDQLLLNQRNYTLGFYLKDFEGNLKDTLMYSVLNKAPSLSIIETKNMQDKIVFELDLLNNLDIKNIKVYDSDDNENFNLLKTENIFNTNSVSLPVFYEEVDRDSDIFYKFLPTDSLGSGYFSEVVSASIVKPVTNSSLPIAEINQQLDQSLLSVYFAQGGGDLNIQYSTNNKSSFDFAQYSSDGRELGYNVSMDCSYYSSGQAENRLMSLNNIINLNLSSQSTESKTSFYKKSKVNWSQYGNQDLSLSINNLNGLDVEQFNIEIEKFYK